MSENWISGFQGIGQVCFDREAKEFVEISNGHCTLDHSSPEAFALSHGPGGMGCCVFAPSEAIAHRVVGLTPNGDPIVAFTYRGVKPENEDGPGPWGPCDRPKDSLGAMSWHKRLNHAR